MFLEIEIKMKLEEESQSVFNTISQRWALWLFLMQASLIITKISFNTFTF